VTKHAVIIFKMAVKYNYSHFEHIVANLFKHEVV